MAVDPGQVEQVHELFGGLGAIRTRRMFGGLGVYSDDLFFALADDGLVFVKVDPVTEAAFRAAGSEPFTFPGKDGELNVMSYWRLPDLAYDEPEEAQRWGRLGLEAALRARTAKGGRKAKA